MRWPLIRAAIERWHWGKIAILWAWGGLFGGLLLTDFLSRPVDQAPGLASLTFLFTLALLGLLTAITWCWLGGREKKKGADGC